MTACPHLNGSLCDLATELAKGVPVPTTLEFCGICTKSDKPRAVNGTVCLLAYAVTKDPEIRTLFDSLCCGTAESSSTAPSGPGTELKKLISWFYSPDKRKCKCRTRIQKMNQWGPDECEQRMETILRWLKHSAKIAKIPFFRPIAMKLVQTAINRSRLKIAQSRLPLLRVKTAP